MQHLGEIVKRCIVALSCSVFRVASITSSIHVLHLPFKGMFLVSYVNKKVLMYNLEMDEAYK